MSLNRISTPKLRALEEQTASLRGQLAAAEDEERTERERLEEKMEKAGIHYAMLVHSLHERLRIEPEHARIVDSADGPIEVATDEDEKQRAERLDAMLTVVLHDEDPRIITPIQMDDAAGRDRSHDERAGEDQHRARRSDHGERR